MNKLKWLRRAIMGLCAMAFIWSGVVMGMIWWPGYVYSGTPDNPIGIGMKVCLSCLDLLLTAIAVGGFVLLWGDEL